MPHSAKKNIVISAARSSVRVFFLLIHKFILPVTRDVWRVVRAMIRPLTQLFVRTTVSGVRNLHTKKHWVRRSGATLWGNAIGLCIAMLSAQLVAQFIEVRGAGNLWGLFSKRTLVSENGYRLVSFIVEFMVTLVVFSAIEYFMDQRRQNKQPDVDQDDE